MIVPGEVATALVERLRDRLGPSHVLTGESDMESALVELRGLYRGSAIALVRPADVEEVSFVVEQSARHSIPVVAQGGNTGLVGGGVPFGGIVLSLSRLDRVRAIDPLNGTMTVEAGCVLQAVQAAAAAAGYLFPFRLPPKARARSAAIWRRMPAEPRFYDMATPASSPSGWKWCSPTGASGTG